MERIWQVGRIIHIVICIVVVHLVAYYYERSEQELYTVRRERTEVVTRE